MKAITCPQCGALVKRISLRDKFALCDYCTAKILLPEDKGKFIEIADENAEPELTPYQKYLKKREENALKYAAMNPPVYTPMDDDSPAVGKFVVFGIAIFALVIIFFATGRSCLDRPFDAPRKTVATTSTPPYTPSFKMPEPTFYPQVNYTVNVKWSGNNDMEDFVMPDIDESKLTTFDHKELKKTVFANRSVQVRVTIGENGEVTQAKATSGHPILKEAAENAARKTLFSNRSKPTNRVLTYIFRLTDE